MNLEWRPTLLHLSIVLALFSLYQFLPEYHSGNLARILVLCVYAMGFNILFGYTGLLSLGHALFFSAGMYGLGLSIQFFGFSPIPAMLAGLVTALVFSVVIGFLALRTTGVAFMIVTLMFAQAGYLTILAAGTYTRGDEGFPSYCFRSAFYCCGWWCAADTDVRLLPFVKMRNALSCSAMMFSAIS